MSERGKKITGDCDHIWDKSVYTMNDSGPMVVCTICGKQKPIVDNKTEGR